MILLKWNVKKGKHEKFILNPSTLIDEKGKEVYFHANMYTGEDI